MPVFEQNTVLQFPFADVGSSSGVARASGAGTIRAIGFFDDKLSFLDSGEGAPATKQAPGGAYVAVFGPAGSTATVEVG